MAARSPSAIAERFGPVGLAELEGSAAALLDRVDRKYVVPVEVFAALATRLGATHRVLDIGGVRACGYHTTYYDTPGLDASRDHLQRRRRRYKCRSRRYEDSGTCAFELKLKGRCGRTVKHRMAYASTLHGTVSPEALRFLRERLALAYGGEPREGLGPALTMAFRRLTLADLERGERLTCDFDLVFAGAGERAGRLDERAVILESKSARGAAGADRVLRDLGARPVEACSKYCLGIGMTRSHVPVNPFRRLLTRWFVPMAASAGLALGAGPAPEVAAAAPGVARVEIDGPRTIPDRTKADARMRVVARGRIVHRGRVGIEVRGQSSRHFAKRQYAVETDRSAALLGLPREDDWVLSAAHIDKSLMRNALGFAAARRLGRYASRTRFAELWLNGRYRGVYTLLERPELGRHRVRGEALLELTEPHKLAPGEGAFRSPVSGRLLAFYDPEREELPGAAVRGIASAVAAAEGGLARGDLSGFDAGAAVDYVLLSELLKNQDAFHSSTFATLDRAGQVVLGPLWDLDLALGSAVSAPLAAAEGWLTADRTWAGGLLARPGFRAALAARWAALRRAGLVRWLQATAARWGSTLRASAARNFRRWPILDRRMIPAGTRTGAFAREVAYLQDWLGRRAAWLDRELGA